MPGPGIAAGWCSVRFNRRRGNDITLVPVILAGEVRLLPEGLLRRCGRDPNNILRLGLTAYVLALSPLAVLALATLERLRSDHMVAFIGLNPSTADEVKNDPTVRRCIIFAKDVGFGGMVMLNAFAYRATDRNEMKRRDGPGGAGQRRLSDRGVEVVRAGGRVLGRSRRLAPGVRSNSRNCSRGGGFPPGADEGGSPRHPPLPAGERGAGGLDGVEVMAGDWIKIESDV